MINSTGFCAVQLYDLIPFPKKSLTKNQISLTVMGKLEALGQAFAVENFSLKAISDRESISQKHGFLWRCTAKFPDRFGGSIFRVDLSDQYNHFTYPAGSMEWKIASDKKNKFYFPAVEPTAKEVSELKFPPVEFGYCVECSEKGVYLYLPDAKALSARYGKLQQDPSSKWPKGVVLKIYSCKGTASNREFVEAYLLFDIILSLGSEFVHDHIFHVLRVLNCMLNLNYSEEKERLRAIVRSLYQAIVQAEEMLQKKDVDDLKSQIPKLWTTLGAAVDLLWSAPDINETEHIDLNEFEEQFVTKIWDDVDYQAFWHRKFNEKIDSSAVANLWKQIKALIK